MNLNPLDFVGEIFGFGKEYVKGKNAVKLGKLEAKAENYKKTLDIKHSWEITAMSSAMYLRWVIVFHMFVGMDASIYLSLTDDPDPMKIMVVLDALPEYYKGFLATIIGFSFGSEPLKNAGAKVATGFVKMKAKRDAAKADK